MVPYVYVNRVQAFYSDHFVLQLPVGHRFPMQGRVSEGHLSAHAAGRRIEDTVALHVQRISLAAYAESWQAGRRA